MSVAQKMIPLNLEEEKKKFFFDISYNPQFVYAQTITDEDLYSFGPFGDAYVATALSILKEVLKKWGSESAYLEAVEGPILTRPQAENAIRSYLQEAGLDQKVKVVYTHKQVARTQILGYEMRVRLPIEYRAHALRGILHHEIGTHVMRRINDEKQPWHGKREQYGLPSYIETEEGLALLNTYLDHHEPYLWINALQYYACYLASQHSFAQVYAALKPYIDTPERRWKVTLRAKRGIKDTSKPGGFTKDKVYLAGVVKVARWMQEHAYDPHALYIGKVSIEDLSRVTQIPGVHLNPQVPSFLFPKETYKKQIQQIIKYNKLV